MIGQNIIYNIYKNKYSESFGNYTEFKEKYNFDTDNLIRIGQIFLYLFINNGIIKDNYGTFEISSFRREATTITIYKEYMNEIIDNIIIEPTSLPMISQPNMWSDNSYGGLLSNIEDKKDLTTGSIFKHNHNIENKECLYKAINTLNSIKFRINTDLLVYIFNKGKYLIDVSNDSQQAITLRIAQFYKDIEFYLTTHSDWRGRILQIPILSVCNLLSRI